MRRNIFDEIHDEFRATARAFFERECVPNTEKWERDGKVSREAWLCRRRARSDRLGARRRSTAAWGSTTSGSTRLSPRRCSLTGSVGIGLGVQNDILVPYLNDLTTDEQKERWLPKFISGEYIGSIAMSRARGRVGSRGHQDHRA